MKTKILAVLLLCGCGGLPTPAEPPGPAPCDAGTPGPMCKPGPRPVVLVIDNALTEPGATAVRDQIDQLPDFAQIEAELHVESRGIGDALNITVGERVIVFTEEPPQMIRSVPTDLHVFTNGKAASSEWERLGAEVHPLDQPDQLVALTAPILCP